MQTEPQQGEKNQSGLKNKMNVLSKWKRKEYIILEKQVVDHHDFKKTHKKKSR